MRINAVAFAVLLGAAAHFGFAQSAATVDGDRIEEIVVDRGGELVAGATITFFTHQAVRYQATSDSSGVFRVPKMEPGAYEAMIEKTGFVVFPKGAVEVGTGEPVRLRYEMQFGSARHARLTGRVLNSQDKPAANAQIDLIVSPELWRRTLADADGRFTFDNVNPGSYELRAAPSNGSGPEVATYFPSTIDEATAQLIVVRGMAEVDGFRLQTAPVFHVKGVVRGDDGLAARVSVKLVPITKQPAHVVSSFGAYFLTAGEGDAPGPDEAHAITGDDGSFDFPAVRAGDWRIVAEGAPAADPLTGFNLTSSGVAAVIVQDADIANALVRLEAPFTLAGSRVQWLVAQCHLPNPPMVTNCPLDGRLGPQGTVYPVLFRALDGQSSSFKAAVTQPDGTFLLGPFHPGHYLVTPLPAMPNPALTDGHVNDYNGPGFSLPGESSTRHPLDLRPNSGPVELNGGGMFDPDGTRPVNPIARAGPGGVRGTVENGAGAAIVLLPEQYADGRPGQFVFCQPDGSFDARRLTPGKYYAAAFRGLDIEGLRAPELLSRIVSADIRIQVHPDSTAEVKLEASSWHE